MNTAALLPEWLGLLGLLAAEVAVAALGLELLQRANASGIWRRTVWQAGVAVMLLLVALEFSGAGRTLAGWVLTRRTPANGFSEAASLPRFGAASRRASVEPADVVVAPRTTAGHSPTETPVPADRPMHEALLSQAPVGADQPPAPLAPGSSGLSPSVPSAPMSINVHSQPGRAAVVPELPPDSLGVLRLGLIWAAGALVVGLRVAVARCLVLWFGFRRRIVTDAALLRRAGRLAQALGVARRVRMVESNRLASPIAFGVLTPTIGLPPGFSERFDAARQEAMLAHELAHLKAGDPFWCLLADVATVALWWHPAAWWIRRQLHLASELAADEASLLLHDGPRVLAECLVELGGRLVRTPFPGQLRAAGYRSHLGRRVQRLVHLQGVWRPPHRLGALLATSLGPLALAAMVILCSAWLSPQKLTKGNSMKQNWKRSLATLSLLATASSPSLALAQEVPALPPPPAMPSAPRAPGIPAAPQLAGVPAPAAIPAPEPLGRRTGSGLVTPAARPANGGHSAQIEAKLNTIVLDQVTFDGLPLAEVLKYLNDQSCKLDKEKKGLNFLINPNSNYPAAPSPSAGVVDPTTGLPVAAPVEAVDMSSVIIKFNLPLRNVTLKNVLDAIVTVADHPLEYSLEDYGVVFSPGRPTGPAQPLPGRLAAPPLVVRTFKVDTNSFVGGLETAFGIKVEAPGSDSASTRSRKIQNALKELLVQLGVTVDGNKSIFFNELTGLVMVRVAAEDEGVVTAAIETLGGSVVSSYPGGAGGMAVYVPGGGR